VWVHPPYQNVVRKYIHIAALNKNTGKKRKMADTPNHAEREDTKEDEIEKISDEVVVSICVDCSLFFKKKQKVKTELCLSTERGNAKHPMHMCVDFIVSGGCSPRPSSSVLIHGITSMLYEFPRNPIFEDDNQVLFHIMGGAQKYADLFSSSIYDLEEYVCVLKWIWCGCQQILVDGCLAKQFRKYNGDHPGQSQWWRKQLPSACRFCRGCHISKMSHNYSYSIHFALSVASGKASSEEGIKWILAELAKIESLDHPIEHVSVFCTKCCRLSVISYEYDNALKALLHIPPCPKQLKLTMADEKGQSQGNLIVYYISMIQIASKQLQCL